MEQQLLVCCYACHIAPSLYSYLYLYYQVKQWGLKDTFRKELKKHKFKRFGSGGDTSAEPKWAFFNHLRFLSDTVQPRNMSSIVPHISEDCIETGTD
jgi:hypothetical protein